MELENDYSWLRPYMDYDETILWRGRPEHCVLFGKEDAYLIPFSLLWTALCAYYSRHLFSGDVPPHVKPVLVVFFLVAIYFLLGRFVVKAIRQKRSLYVVTTKKVFRRQGRKVEFLRKRAIGPMIVTRHRDGTGTIVFRREKPDRERRLFIGYQFTYSIGYQIDDSFSLVALADVDRALKAINTQPDDQ